MNKIQEAIKKSDTYETPRYLSEIVLQTTNDQQTAAKVFDLITTAVRWVVFMDLYEETKDEQFNTAAQEQHAMLYSFLDTAQAIEFKKLENEIVVPYWTYEQTLKDRIKNNSVFSATHIQQSIFRRSEDAVLYGSLVSYFCPFPQEAIRCLHVRQAFEDIMDCIEDYEEDLVEFEPNIFFMYLLKNHVDTNHFPAQFRELTLLPVWRHIKNDILSFVEEQYKASKNTLAGLQIPGLETQLDEQHTELIAMLG